MGFISESYNVDLNRITFIMTNENKDQFRSFIKEICDSYILPKDEDNILSLVLYQTNTNLEDIIMNKQIEECQEYMTYSGKKCFEYGFIQTPL